MAILGCASRPLPKPTKEHSLAGCYVSCPIGYLNERSHSCLGPQRWFRDIRIVDEYTSRGADGQILTDVYVTDAGDFPKIDVVIGQCTGVMATLRNIAGRAMGLHPGESPPQWPTDAPPEK